MVLRKWSELQTLGSSRQALSTYRIWSQPEFHEIQIQTSKRPPKSDEIILKLMNKNKEKSTYEVDNSQKAGGLEGRQQKRTQNEACKRRHVNKSWATLNSFNT